MSNEVFPTLSGVKKGSRLRTPIFKTQVQTTVSQRELRTAFSLYPRYRYSLDFEYLRSDTQNLEWQTLLAFFNARQGSFDSWLYSDPDDNAVTAQQFGVGNGTMTAFQLVRTLGGYTEPIQNLNGVPQIFKGGTLQATPSDYSIDANGLVTFTTAPGSGVALTWTGFFYYRCRFMQDEQEFARFLAGFWEANKVEFITLKP